MSNAALTWALSIAVERSSDKFILVCLANRADDDGIAFPSQKSLSADTALNRKTVMVGLARLIDAGLIADTGNRKGTTGRIPVLRLIVGAIPTPHPKTPRPTPPTNRIVPQAAPLNAVTVPNLPVSMVPNLPTNGPVFTDQWSQNYLPMVPNLPGNGPKTGTRNPKEPTLNPKGNHTEPKTRARQTSDAQRIWNEICGSAGLPKVIGFGAQREAAFNRVFKSHLEGDIERWRQCCQQIAESEFLTGGTFSMSIDWTLKPANMTKILEGNYRNRQTKPINGRCLDPYNLILNGTSSHEPPDYFDADPGSWSAA